MLRLDRLISKIRPNEEIHVNNWIEGHNFKTLWCCTEFSRTIPTRLREQQKSSARDTAQHADCHFSNYENFLPSHRAFHWKFVESGYYPLFFNFFRLHSCASFEPTRLRNRKTLARKTEPSNLQTRTKPEKIRPAYQPCHLQYLWSHVRRKNRKITFKKSYSDSHTFFYLVLKRVGGWIYTDTQSTIWIRKYTEYWRNMCIVEMMTPWSNIARITTEDKKKNNGDTTIAFPN